MSIYFTSSNTAAYLIKLDTVQQQLTIKYIIISIIIYYTLIHLLQHFCFSNKKGLKQELTLIETNIYNIISILLLTSYNTAYYSTMMDVIQQRLPVLLQVHFPIFYLHHYSHLLEDLLLDLLHLLVVKLLIDFVIYYVSSCTKLL